MYTAFVCDMDNQEPFIIPITDVSTQARVWMQIINAVDSAANITREEEVDGYDTLMIQLIALIPGSHTCMFNLISHPHDS